MFAHGVGLGALEGGVGGDGGGLVLGVLLEEFFRLGDVDAGDELEDYVFFPFEVVVVGAEVFEVFFSVIEAGSG